MDIRVKIDSAEALKAMAAFPGTMESNVDRYLARAASEVESEARRVAPKSFSNLTNSIHAAKDGLWAYQVAPGERYASGVEYGTGPAAGESPYFPNPRALEPYMKQRLKITWTGKPGSKKRADQESTVKDGAWALARYIFAHGTQPHPYMAPTAEKMRPRVEELVDEGVDSGIREAFGS